MRISFIVFDLVNPESIKRKEIVDAMTTTIRPEVVLTMLQITTGPSSRRVMNSNSSALAVW